MATNTGAGAMIPIIPMEVMAANAPPAGVKPPYINDWKPAAKDPAEFARICEYVERDMIETYQ